MRLEEEIKQVAFKNEHHKATVNILYTNNWLNSLFSSFFKPYGVSLQQYNVLRILKGQYPEPTNVNLLIDRMLDKMSNASRLVEKLRLKGLVARKVNKIDKRAVDIIITKKGVELLSKMKNVDIKLERMKVITKEEAKTLNHILDKIRDGKIP